MINSTFHLSCVSASQMMALQCSSQSWMRLVSSSEKVSSGNRIKTCLISSMSNSIIQQLAPLSRIYRWQDQANSIDIMVKKSTTGWIGYRIERVDSNCSQMAISLAKQSLSNLKSSMITKITSTSRDSLKRIALGLSLQRIVLINWWTRILTN